jgi:hypothetical protein
VEEARAVLARLERIEALERDRAPAAAVLREVRALLSEAEAWVRVERPDGDDVLDALERCRKAFQNGRRSLVA